MKTMDRNMYAQPCHECRQMVEKHRGYIEKGSSLNGSYGWRTYHEHCLKTVTKKIVSKPEKSHPLLEF